MTPEQKAAIQCQPSSFSTFYKHIFAHMKNKGIAFEQANFTGIEGASFSLIYFHYFIQILTLSPLLLSIHRLFQSSYQGKVWRNVESSSHVRQTQSFSGRYECSSEDAGCLHSSSHHSFCYWHVWQGIQIGIQRSFVFAFVTKLDVPWDHEARRNHMLWPTPRSNTVLKTKFRSTLICDVSVWMVSTVPTRRQNSRLRIRTSTKRVDFWRCGITAAIRWMSSIFCSSTSIITWNLQWIFTAWRTLHFSTVALHKKSSGYVFVINQTRCQMIHSNLTLSFHSFVETT